MTVHDSKTGVGLAQPTHRAPFAPYASTESVFARAHGLQAPQSSSAPHLTGLQSGVLGRQSTTFAPSLSAMDRLQHVFDLIQIQAAAARSAFARGSHGEGFGILEDVAGAIRYAQEAKRLTEMHKRGSWEHTARRVPSRNSHRRPTSARLAPLEFGSSQARASPFQGSDSAYSDTEMLSQFSAYGTGQSQSHLVGPVPSSAYKANRKRPNAIKYDRPLSRKSHRALQSNRAQDYFSSGHSVDPPQSYPSSSISSWFEASKGAPLTASPAIYGKPPSPITAFRPDSADNNAYELQNVAVAGERARPFASGGMAPNSAYSHEASWGDSPMRPSLVQYNSSPSSISLGTMASQHSHSRFANLNSSMPASPSTPIHPRTLSHLSHMTNSTDSLTTLARAQHLTDQGRGQYASRADTPQSPCRPDEYEYNAEDGNDSDSQAMAHSLDPELKNRLDEIFFRFLQHLCSNLKMTDPSGEPIHQTLMAKKMQRLHESTDFRPFKFRIQAFTNALQDQIGRECGDGFVSGKNLRQYLWNQKHISRFNEDGRKSKSKGNHIWEIQARREPSLHPNDERRQITWTFKEYTRKIVGEPSDATAYVGVKWEWAPRVWDPQVSTSSLGAVFSSPSGSLPPWLSWHDNVLSGTPPRSSTGNEQKQAHEIIAVAKFYDRGDQSELRRSIILTMDPRVNNAISKLREIVNSNAMERAVPASDMMDTLPDLSYSGDLLTAQPLNGLENSVFDEHMKRASSLVSQIDPFTSTNVAQTIDAQMSLLRDQTLALKAVEVNDSREPDLIQQPKPQRARQLTNEFSTLPAVNTSASDTVTGQELLDSGLVARTLTSAPTGLATTAALQVAVAAAAAANNPSVPLPAPATDSDIGMQNLIRAAQTSMEASVIVEKLERKEAAAIDGTVEKVHAAMQVEVAKAEAHKAAAVLEVQAQVQVQAVQVAQIKALHEVTTANEELLRDMSRNMSDDFNSKALDNDQAGARASSLVEHAGVAQAAQVRLDSINQSAAELNINIATALSNAATAMPPPAFAPVVSGTRTHVMDTVDAFLSNATLAGSLDFPASALMGAIAPSSSLETMQTRESGASAMTPGPALAFKTPSISASNAALHTLPPAPPPTPAEVNMQKGTATPHQRSRASSNVSGQVPLAYSLSPEMGMPPDPRASMPLFDRQGGVISVPTVMSSISAESTSALDRALAQVEQDFMAHHAHE